MDAGSLHRELRPETEENQCGSRGLLCIHRRDRSRRLLMERPLRHCAAGSPRRVRAAIASRDDTPRTPIRQASHEAEGDGYEK